MRDENCIAARRHVDGIVIGQPQQNGEHTDMHIGEIPNAFAQHGRRMARKMLPPLQQDQVECLFGAQVLTDECFDTLGQRRIVEDRQLHVKDGCFLGSRLRLSAHAQMPQSLAGALKRTVQPRNFRLDVGIVDESWRDFRDLPP